MGARTVSAMLPQLLAAGLDPETPACRRSAATTPRSKHVFCRARELAEAVEQPRRSEPCLVMLGRALEAAGELQAGLQQQTHGAEQTLGARSMMAKAR